MAPDDHATPGRPRQGYGQDPPHKYGWVTPRFWHGMLPGAFWRMALKNRLAFSPRGVATAATITAVGLGHLTATASQHLLYGKRLAGARPDRPPLFVLGHWRSGTTLLHELLIRDPRNTCPSTYECFAPRHFLVTERWLTPLIGWLLPKKRPMDNVATGWDRPQEDEFALCSMGLPSPYRTWAFPRNGPADADWLTLDGLSDDDRARWVAALQRFVGTISLSRQGRVVLKSPPHTARVKTLLRAFPDARFVHITRDPLVLFPSTVRLWKSLCDVQTLQWSADRYEWIEEEVLGNLERMYQAFETDRALIPEGRLTELRYEDLVEDPKGELAKVYDRLGMEGFAEAEPRLDAYLADLSGYKKNRYTLPEDVERRVRDRWGAYAQRYGYA